MTKVFGYKRKQLRGVWRTLHTDCTKTHNPHKILLGWSKQGGRDECRHEKHVQIFGRKTLSKKQL